MQARSFFYRAYGLTIRSALELPGLIPGEAREDVSIHLRRIDCQPGYSESYDVKVEDDEAILSWGSVGVFLVRKGEEIIVMRSSRADDDEVRLFLLGPVMAVLLFQRG